MFLTATVRVHCVWNLNVLHRRVFFNRYNQSDLNRTWYDQFQVCTPLFPCSLSPTILLLLFMRSTLYCHCMGGYSCPYLELFYQYTTLTTEQSRCQQTVTTSINSKVCDMMVDFYFFILITTFMFHHVHVHH